MHRMGIESRKFHLKVNSLSISYPGRQLVSNLILKVFFNLISNRTVCVKIIKNLMFDFGGWEGNFLSLIFRFTKEDV